MRKISSEDALILNVVRFARLCVRVLPLSVSLWLGRRIGDLVFVLSRRRNVAIRNLRMVYAEQKSTAQIRRIARLSFRSMGMSAIELLRIPDMTQADVARHFTIEGREHFEPYLRLGKGIIFLTGHFGSWELLNIVSGLVGHPMVALARVQKHPRSDAYLNSLRASKGSQIIHKGMPVREILRALKEGRIVGILSDQDGGKNGRFVNFFGRLSSTPAGAATFSLRTGAPIFPAFIMRTKGAEHHVVIERPIEIADPSLTPEEAETRILQRFAESLERRVRQAPEQWLWAHRRWKSSPERHVTILSDGKAGHSQQSMAVFDALRHERNRQGFPADTVRPRIIEVRYRSHARRRLWKVLGLLFRGRPPFSQSLIRWALDQASAEGVLASYADIVISCGSSLTELNLWIKKENAARSVVVMRPDAPVSKFDAVIAPRHDGLRIAPNVFITDGALTRLDPATIRLEGARLAAETGLEESGRYLGFLIGGDTPEVHFEPSILERVALAVRRFAVDKKLQVLMTTSRRTPSWAETLLKDVFADRSICPVRVIANEANRPGVVAGILSLSSAVIVSGESMSMLSEAVSGGKPVVVFHPYKNAGLKKKYQELLTRWQEKGRLTVAAAEAMIEALSFSTSGVHPIPSSDDEQDAVLSQAAKKVLS